MENLLITIANVSVVVFGTVISLVLSLRLAIGIVKWRVKTTEARLEIITKELEIQMAETAAIEEEFKQLDGGKCDPCTKDDPNIGCKTAQLDSRIKTLKEKSARFKKEHSFFINTSRIINTFFLSPLGTILTFIVNSDPTDERSKS